jgi:hypothetical protein
MGETPLVVNLFTKSDWAAKLKEALQTKQDVILLGIPSEPERAREINKLCEAAGYSTPESLPESEWSKYQGELNLGGTAAKEQGYAPNAISVARPR